VAEEDREQQTEQGDASHDKTSRNTAAHPVAESADRGLHRDGREPRHEQREDHRAAVLEDELREGCHSDEE
jgi:hypothetical protein